MLSPCNAEQGIQFYSSVFAGLRAIRPIHGDRFNALKWGAGLPGYVGERSTALVADQQTSLAERIRLPALFLTQADCSIGEEEVGPAVVVEVEPSDAKSGIGKRDRVYSGLERRIG